MILQRAVMGLACLAFTFSLFPAPVSAMVNTEAQFSGKQLFEGVFFGEGPVADRMPEIWNDDVRSAMHMDRYADRQKLRNGIHVMESRIEKIDRGYFQQLRTALTSGDPGLVSYAIDRSKSDISRVNLSSRAGSPSAVRPDLKLDAENVNINVNYSYAYAVFILAVVAFGLAVVVAVAAVPLERTASTSVFTREQTVAMITRNLAAQ